MEQRIRDIEAAIQQSLLQHHMLLGRLEEAKYLLEQEQMQKVFDDNQGEFIPNKKGKK